MEGWRLLRAALKDQRRGLIAGVVVGLLWSAGKVAVPKLTSLAIDHAVLGSGSLLWWSLLIGAMAVVAGTFTAWRRWYAFKESRFTETIFRERLFDHIMRLHVGYHDRTQTGQLMSRASSDLLQIQGFVVMIPITMSNLAMVVAIVAILASVAVPAYTQYIRRGAMGGKAVFLDTGAGKGGHLSWIDL